jgi:hypothetical protein
MDLEYQLVASWHILRRVVGLITSGPLRSAGVLCLSLEELVFSILDPPMGAMLAFKGKLILAVDAQFAWIYSLRNHPWSSSRIRGEDRKKDENP